MKSVLRYLPLVIGPAVLVAIFFFADLSFEDQSFDAEVQSIDSEQGVVSVLPKGEGKKAISLPLSSSPALSPEGIYAEDPSQALGETLSFTKRGILSLLSGVGVSNALLILGLTILALCLQAWRLALLYSCAGHHAKWRHAFRALLIGLLYGNVLPAGQVGGDPIKAFYLAKLTDGKRTHALATVLIDRALGLAILAAIAGGAIALGSVVISDPKMRLILLIVLGLGLGGTAALLSSRLRKAIGVSALVKKLPLASVQAKLGGALREVSASRRVLAGALVLSFLAHLALIAAVFVVAMALELGLPFSEFVAKVPVANIVASLPLAPPGGWGFGEWAYMMLFAAVGAEAAFALSAVPRLAMLFVSLWGVVASWQLPPKPEGLEITESEVANSAEQALDSSEVPENGA